MIKTLQISSILAVVLAAVLFVSSVVFGAYKDEDIESFLKSPGVREQFTEAMAAGPKGRKNRRESPLVEMAQRFKGIVDPDKPKIAAKTPPKTSISVPTTPVKPPESSVKWKLFGTVVCESDPEASLALIDEPGKGSYMVRQGSEVMHLTIEQIKDGLVVVRDAKMIEEGPLPTSIPALPPGTSRGRPVIPPSASSKIRSGIPARPSPSLPASNGRRGPATPSSIRSRLNQEENARLEALGNRLKAMQESKAARGGSTTPTMPQLPPGSDDDYAIKMMKKLMEDAKKDEAAAAAAAKAKQDPNISRGARVPPIPPRPGSSRSQRR